MTPRLLGGALIAAVLGSAAFQIALLAIAGWKGGPEKVGEVSLHLAIALLACAIGLSDLKSLSIRHLVENRSLAPLCEVRNFFLVLILAIAVIGWSVPHGSMLASLLVLRASTQAADINVSAWQKQMAPAPIVAIASLRYGGMTAVLFGVAAATNNVELGLAAAAAFSVAILGAEQEMLRRIYPGLGLTWRPFSNFCRANIADLRIYFSLSFAGGLNFLPHVITRYQMIFFGSFSILGHFSVQYQISMLSIPIITAISQHALARRVITLQNITRDIFKIGSLALSIILTTIAFFLTDLSYFVEMIFRSWVPLNTLQTILVSIIALSQCLTVYLGFMTVALHKPAAQMTTNLWFLGSLLVLGFAFGIAWASTGVLLGFAVASCVRLALLIGIVSKAARPAARPAR